MKDAAQGVAEDVPQDVAKDLAFGVRAARALLVTAAAAFFRLCAARARAEILIQLGSSVVLIPELGSLGTTHNTTQAAAVAGSSECPCRGLGPRTKAGSE